jgi:hypothetical protein
MKLAHVLGLIDGVNGFGWKIGTGGKERCDRSFAKTRQTIARDV